MGLPQTSALPWEMAAPSLYFGDQAGGRLMFLWAWAGAASAKVLFCPSFGPSVLCFPSRCLSSVASIGHISPSSCVHPHLLFTGMGVTQTGGAL